MTASGMLIPSGVKKTAKNLFAVTYPKVGTIYALDSGTRKKQALKSYNLKKNVNGGNQNDKQKTDFRLCF